METEVANLRSLCGYSLIKGVRQRLHSANRHQAMAPCGEHGALPHVVLARVLHHQQVVLFEQQLLFFFTILLISIEQRLSKEGSCNDKGSCCRYAHTNKIRPL